MRVSSRPFVARTAADTVALVMVWSSRPSNGRCPGFTGLGNRRISNAVSVPSAPFDEVTARKSPGLMSLMAIGWVKTISVLSPT
ncbi:hypothetical protein D3C83_47270 [compost metagenome]